MEAIIFTQRLSNLLTQEGVLFDFVKSDIERLQTELELMWPFLRDFGGYKQYNRDVDVDEMALQIIDGAFRAEDAIDTYIGITNGRQQKSRKELKRHQADLQIVLCGVVEGFSSIQQRMKKNYENPTKQPGVFRSVKYQPLNNSSSSSTVVVGGRGRKREPIVEEIHIVGREYETDMLLYRLVEGESRLTVVSIVGKGGLGKTTLANEAFNSVYIQNHFDCRAWVYVSYDFGPEKVLEALLKCLMPMPLSVMKKGGMNEGELLMREIRNSLSNKTYLIVLDDVWVVDFWEQLSKAFPNDHNGSRILITTRDMELARVADPRSRPIRLECLTEKEGRKLLFNRVFEDGNCPPDLEQVGRSLAVACGGLPLLILLVRGLLSSKTEKLNLWKELVCDLREVIFEAHGTDFYLVVKFFYNGLPPHLKPCFIYFCTFPEYSSDISTRHLFQLWIAEGFIQGNSEATAEDYLEELIDRGWIQVVRRRSDGKTKTCKIHLLPWELSLSVAENLRFLQSLSSDRQYSPSKCRRLAIHGSVPELDFHAPHVRSILYHTSEDGLPRKHCKQLSKSFNLLRVLDFGAVVFEDFPDGIENLFHLRYLRLNAPSLRSIPSSLGNLRNLYTLDMPYSSINVTTDVIWKMQNLRHLNFRFISLPGHTGKDCNFLVNLNFLSALCPSSCNSDVLGRVPNLQTMRICGDLSTHHEALSVTLAQLHHLESLKLVRDTNSSQLPSTFVTKFHFPTSLSHLTLSDTELREDPMPALEKLPNLQVLKLKRNSYMGRKLACSSGGFPRLQVLHLKSMQWLEEWTMGTGALPLLVCLVINPCAYLRRLPEELWRVKSFCKLELWWPRPELKLKLQEIEEMDRHDIKIYPSGL